MSGFRKVGSVIHGLALSTDSTGPNRAQALRHHAATRLRVRYAHPMVGWRAREKKRADPATGDREVNTRIDLAPPMELAGGNIASHCNRNRIEGGHGGDRYNARERERVVARS